MKGTNCKAWAKLRVCFGWELTNRSLFFFFLRFQDSEDLPMYNPYIFYLILFMCYSYWIIQPFLFHLYFISAHLKWINEYLWCYQRSLFIRTAISGPFDGWVTYFLCSIQGFCFLGSVLVPTLGESLPEQRLRQGFCVS